jgi:hypothetical protein
MERYKITFVDIKDKTDLFTCIHGFHNLQEVINWAYELAGTHKSYKNTDIHIKIELITDTKNFYYYAGQE